ncbi:NADPH-dependent F420 reductase [Salinispora arenicola]|uniref:NADPH-dependent F420 reductase n=1 Tax=Salinispora arenicola TaxID=168697 RepID=UPI0003617582|nr:NAD(P)-binding domain-containing protein [Salinispora arenicola]
MPTSIRPEPVPPGAVTSRTVGVLGRGRMGSALARALALDGRRVLIAGRRDPARPDPPPPSARVQLVPAATVVAEADPLVLVLPFAAVLELARAGLLQAGQGRTMVDATNPPAAGVSGHPRAGGRLLAELLPQWHVVKALNTVPAGMLGRPVLDGRPVTVPLAGDHPPAKAQVAALLCRLGFVPVDVGGIDRAPALESLADLLMAIDSRHSLGGRLGFQLGLAEPMPAQNCGPGSGTALLRRPAEAFDGSSAPGALRC